MTPSEIKPGMMFGHWKVIKFDHMNEHRVKYFLCECEVCGNKRPVRATALINGTSKACSKSCSSSIVGQTFGRWKVLKEDKSQPRYVICQCECGAIRSMFSGSLKQGVSLSCGCLKAENIKNRHQKTAEERIGEKHGLLTIEDYFLKNNNYYYKCKCECGNYINVLGKRLLDGETCSCGCINSKANMRMAQILDKMNIPYKREYRFAECKDKGTLPFDFAIFNKENELIGLIENNGNQHYSARGTQWNTPERLTYTQKHDYIKQKFAEDNHIPLLIIPYQYFEEKAMKTFLTSSDFWSIIIKNFND